MSNELERLRTTNLSQESEIARLTQGYEDLKYHCEMSMFIDEDYDKYNKYHNDALRLVISEINKITGNEK